MGWDAFRSLTPHASSGNIHKKAICPKSVDIPLYRQILAATNHPQRQLLLFSTVWREKKKKAQVSLPLSRQSLKLCIQVLASYLIPPIP